MSDDDKADGYRDAWLLVMADMAARRQVGLNRYDKAVDPFDAFEDWLQHAYEERLDELVYIKAELVRRRAARHAPDSGS